MVGISPAAGPLSRLRRARVDKVQRAARDPEDGVLAVEAAEAEGFVERDVGGPAGFTVYEIRGAARDRRETVREK